MTQVRAIVFTLNNPEGPEDMDKLKALKPLGYLVYQHERGKQGTPHYQGYAQFKTPVKFTTLKKALPRAHIERARGTPQEASDYCKKTDTQLSDPVEWGTISHHQPGKRNDILVLKEHVDAGNPVEQLYDNEDTFEAMAKYGPYMEAYQARKRRRIERQRPYVLVLYGPTGHGKTVTSEDIIEQWTGSPDEVFVYDYEARFQNGYHGQRGVLMEEFRGQIKYPRFLQLCDQSIHIKVELKNVGTAVPWSPEIIVINSPLPPHQWYPRQDVKDSVAQLLRRITYAHDVSVPYTIPELIDHLRGSHYDDAERQWVNPPTPFVIPEPPVQQGPLYPLGHPSFGLRESPRS